MERSFSRSTGSRASEEKAPTPYVPAPDYHQPEPEPEPTLVVPSLRPFPKVLAEALWVLIEAVRADPTYARNLRVRLAVFQGNDAGPLTAILDAMAAEETG